MTADHSTAAEPPRPRDLTPEELGFTPQPPVAWLSPGQLSRTAIQVVLSEVLGAFLDKRELQNALPSRLHREPGDGDELWLDFVADLGDGFDATYSVAYLLAQPSLTVNGEVLPRGQVLIMGGDEVYPTASVQRYEDRMKGPYQAALPQPGATATVDGSAPQPGAATAAASAPPNLYALPGNHDWYDGLTAFLRLFVNDGRDNIGRWRTAQARSYFAIELPHRWWLFAVDMQFGTYIDDPQMRYFEEVASQLRPGDRVILCVPSPGWVESTKDPSAYDGIDYFVRTVLRGEGISVKLMLSGDLHHYARYEGADRQLIHCGGGGAYLYPTHLMPRSIEVPPNASIVRKASDSQSYRLAETFPTAEASRRFASGVFVRIPRRNPGFIGLLGTLHALFMLGVVNLMQHPHGSELRLATVPVAIMGTIIYLAAQLFAIPPTSGKRHRRHWVAGAAHGVVHLGLGVIGADGWLHLPFVHWPWPLPLIAALVVYGLVVGLLATEVVCLYLLVASRWGVNANELFASQGIEDAKSFLRIRIASDGLTVYPIGVPRVARQWTADPDGAPGQPWVRPDQPLEYVAAGDVVRIS